MSSGTLSHYEILDRLGEGGMGTVYRAVDTRLGRPVAVKLLRPELAGSGENKKRFVQEARAASALNHPHIVTIYDIGQDQGIDFIAMEYVAGSSLAERLARGRLRIEEALDYAVQIADALAAAHGAGIVHLDLKPANIIVSDKGAIKILDFGLAKLTQRSAAELDTGDRHARMADRAHVALPEDDNRRRSETGVKQSSWDRVKHVFQEALDAARHERMARARELCGSDRALLVEVESLLETHQRAGSFAERPAVELLDALSLAHDSRVGTTAGPVFSSGTRLGVYEIQSLAGTGGMGEVYLAPDTRLDRTVAIKVQRAFCRRERCCPA